MPGQFVPKDLALVELFFYDFFMEFNYREELKNIFRERKSRNSGYSLRAFSRDLDVSSTALSDVLSNKRNFSEKNAKKISEKLGFSPAQFEKMLSEVKKQTLDVDVQNEVMQIKEDEFNLISHWYFLAILTLSEQRNISSDPAYIARRLGIRTEEAVVAIGTLVRLGLLTSKSGKLKRASLPFRTTTDIPSYAIRKYHKDNLKVAEHSLENVPLELREISSMSLNIDPKKIKKAKKLINKFKEEFTKEMEKTSAKEVYTLAMHFFPASLKGKKDD
jgi:uncharacterized protein (TIGR02147 family)